MAIDFRLASVDGCKASLIDSLDNIEEDFLWLEEILTECKNTFSSSKLYLLPKTPSEKKRPPKRRGRKRLTGEELDPISETESSETTQPHESSSSEASLRPRRTTRATSSRASQAAAPSRPSRATRASKIAARQDEETEDSGTFSSLRTTTVRQAEGMKDSGTTGSLRTTTARQAEGMKDSVTFCSLLTTTARQAEGMKDSGTTGSLLTADKRVTMVLPPRGERLELSPQCQRAPEFCEVLPQASAAKDADCGRSKDESPVSDAHRKVDTPQQQQACLATCRQIDNLIVVSDSDNSDVEVVNSSRSSRRDSCELSIAGSRRSSLRVLGSKSRLRSLHGHLSVTGPVMQAIEQNLENLVFKVARQSEGKMIQQEKNKVNTKSPTGSTRTRTRQAQQRKSRASVAAVETEPAEEPGNTRSKSRKRQVEDEAEAPEELQSKKCCLESAGHSETNTSDVQTIGKDGDHLETTDDISDHNNVKNTEPVIEADMKSPSSRPDTRTRQLDERRSRESSVVTVQMEPLEESRVTRTKTRKLTEEEVSSAQPAQSSGDEYINNELSTSAVNDSGSDHSKTFGPAMKSDEDSPTSGPRTRTRQAKQSKSRESVIAMDTEPAEESRMTRTKARKRQAETEAPEVEPKKSCLESPSQSAKHNGDIHILSDEQMNDDDDNELIINADDDSDYEDIENTEPVIKKKPVPSLLTRLRKSSLNRSTSFVSGVVSSFLKRNTPPRKPSMTYMQEQKKKDLVQKEKIEQERLSRLEVIKKNKADEQKRKREERMKKVAEMREMRQKKESDLKKNMAEKLKERLNSTDRMKEERFKEEREKQKIRLKRQLEADERRRQEEEQRLQRLLEQQEEQRIHEELMQRKREQEEQERQRKLSEERRRQEERQAEAERQKQIEAERLLQQELERERERQREKENKEKREAQERAERDRQELERKRERELKIQKELEKLKEMEQQRLVRMAAMEEEKRKEEARLQQIINSHNRNLANLGITTTLTLTASTTTVTTATAPVMVVKTTAPATVVKTTATAPATVVKTTVQPAGDSYPLTPVQQKKKKSSGENYDIGDLGSDDSTDEEEAPRKKIPTWAQGANLKAMLINQTYNPPNLDAIFTYIAPPDLNDMFERKRPRFNKRTSSAVWHSPLHKKLHI